MSKTRMDKPLNLRAIVFLSLINYSLSNVVALGLSEVIYIKVNNTNVPFSGGSSWNIPTTAVISNTFLDVIEIKVVSYEEIDDFNVGALIASVSFLNEKNTIEYLESGSNWFCNGESASVISHPYLKDINLNSEITSGSKWIWSDIRTSLEVICIGQIRARIRNPRIEAISICNNQVLSMWVGSVYLGKGEDCLKCFVYGEADYYIKSGDEIVLEGRDLHVGEQDIQGRITIYENEWFEYEEIFTDLSWTCNGSLAIESTRSGLIPGAISIRNRFGTDYIYCTKKYFKENMTKYADECP